MRSKKVIWEVKERVWIHKFHEILRAPERVF